MAQAQVTLKVSPAELRTIRLALSVLKEVCRVVDHKGFAIVDVKTDPKRSTYIWNTTTTGGDAAHMLETIG